MNITKSSGETTQINMKSLVYYYIVRASNIKNNLNNAFIDINELVSTP